MRPPLLQLGGEANFADYQREFDLLLPTGLIDVLGNQVIFSGDRCHHICFKPENKKWNIGPRDIWMQDRADRIPWIKTALTVPKHIRVTSDNGSIWTYMVEIPGDSANDLPPELFAAIVNAEKITPDQPGRVYFLTAYSVDFAQWNEWKRNRPWIYPPGAPPPKKTRRTKN